MKDGNRCGKGCNGSTLKNAIVYFPPGTYLVSSTIEVLFGTQVIGDVVPRHVCSITLLIYHRRTTGQPSRQLAALSAWAFCLPMCMSVGPVLTVKMPSTMSILPGSMDKFEISRLILPILIRMRMSAPSTIKSPRRPACRK